MSGLLRGEGQCLGAWASERLLYRSAGLSAEIGLRVAQAWDVKVDRVRVISRQQ